jgi:D-alanyl-D-alanine carboxypeptidase
MELKRINNENNNWTKEDILKFIYGKKPTNKVGETYFYSNTNFLLLSLILESAAGKPFKEIYQDEIFNPLQLSSAYYDENQPIPDNCVKGYIDMHDNQKFIESGFLYGDELGIGGDGGIAINAYDMAMFLEKLWKGNVISPKSLSTMTNWFNLPDEWQWKKYGQFENGFGIEKFNSQYGYAIGHSGYIDGFNSKAFYFPNQDMTFILFVNSVGNSSGSKECIYKATLEEMFK